MHFDGKVFCVGFEVWFYDGPKIPQREYLSQVVDTTGKSYTFIAESKINSLKEDVKDIYGPCH